MRRPANTTGGVLRSLRTSATSRRTERLKGLFRSTALGRTGSATVQAGTHLASIGSTTGSSRPCRAWAGCITPPAIPISRWTTIGRRYNTRPTWPNPRIKPAPTTASPTPTTPRVSTTWPASTGNSPWTSSPASALTTPRTSRRQRQDPRPPHYLTQPWAKLRHSAGPPGVSTSEVHTGGLNHGGFRRDKVRAPGGWPDRGGTGNDSGATWCC